MGGARRLIAREPGQKPDRAREMRLPGTVPDLVADYTLPVDIELATFSETVFLRLVRASSAELVTGLHARAPQQLPAWIDEEGTPLSASKRNKGVALIFTRRQKFSRKAASVRRNFRS